MLRFGPDTGPVAIMALPLFEEANRTRAFAVTMLRALAARGVASVLPDLPGQGESLVTLSSLTIEMLRSAHRALTDQLWGGARRTYALGMRSGALLDADSQVFGRWHFAPQDGRDLLRELSRSRQAALGAKPPLRDDRFVDLIDDDGRELPVEIAGNVVGPGLLGSLRSSSAKLPRSAPMRVVRLATDRRPADLVVDGPPLWRRTEPGNDITLAHTLAADIADWIVACEG